MTRDRTFNAEEPATNDERTDGESRSVDCEYGSELSAGQKEREATCGRSREVGRADQSGTFGRRDYLRVLGGVGAAGVVGSRASTTATAQSAFDEAAADQRIRENQTGPLTVEIVDQSGNPVSDVDVAVEMQEHDFVWGAEVAADLLVNQYGDGHPYRENFLDLFNTAVLENIHKWAIWEGNQSLADEAVDWLNQRGYRIRGHTCIYPVDYAIPADVQTAIDNGNGQLIRDRTMQQIEDIITHYGDRIQEWDVVNEVLHRGLLHSGVYPDQIDLDDLPAGEIQPWRSQLLADWYAKAESVIDQNGLNVDVVTNDYNTLTWSYARSRYADQIGFLQNQGIGVDGIGLQAHIGAEMDGSDLWTYDNINGVFDHYAQFNTNIRITEYDMTGDSWTGQQQRADVMHRYLKTAYGHPDVDEFTVWGFWDNAHWRDEAPFFEEDWTEKPALDVYRTLVFDEWWTSESGTTDDSGTYVVDAFLGEHEVTVSTDEGSVTRTVAVTDANTGRQITVSVEGDGATPADPPSVTPVQLNGTYRVENVNSGHVLSIENGSTADEASVVQRSYAGELDQHWTLEHLGDGIHRIENVASGSSLDVLDGEVADGANVVQWPWHGGNFQRFLVGEVGDGDLAIVAQHSNRVLEVDDASTADGATVQQWADNGGDHQRWTVTAVDDGGPPAVGNNASAPTDPDGDGRYEDVNGNGRIAPDDVVDLFEHLETPAVQNNVDAYDFSANGEVTITDVVTLFEDL